MGTGGNETSRIGFRGTEDLGGSVSASFWLEGGVNADTGTGQSTNTNNLSTGGSGSGGLAFNRRSTASLSGNLGEIRLGRDYTPAYSNLGAFDAFGVVGAGINMAYQGLLNTATPNSKEATVVRVSNSIAYILPSTLGGLYGTVQTYRGENSGTKDGNGSAIRLGYDDGAINAAMATGTTKYAAGDLRMTNAGASWKFDMVKVMGEISRDRIGQIKGKAYQVGAQVTVGAGEIRLAHSRYSTDQINNPTTKKYAVGYVYNLSKRTALYTTAAHAQNSGGLSYAINGATTAANGSSNGYDFGIRHRF